jgi:small subunit ribosomal protein S1
VREFGAFVDLGGGVQGLLHVSEMGWSRVSDTSAVVAPGDEITVKVLRVDDDTQKIALGLKQLSADPWLTVKTTYRGGSGAQWPRDAPHGVWGVRRARAGIEGLAHAPRSRRRALEGVVPIGRRGMTAAFEILSIDLEKKRIGVALVEEGSTRRSRRGASEIQRSCPARGSPARSSVTRSSWCSCSSRRAARP